MAERTLYERAREGLTPEQASLIVFMLVGIASEGGQMPDDSGGVMLSDDCAVRVIAPTQRNYALQAPEVLRALLQGASLPQPTTEQALYTVGMLAYEALTGKDYCLEHGIRLTDVGTNQYYRMGELVSEGRPYDFDSPDSVDPELSRPSTIPARDVPAPQLAEAIAWWTCFRPELRHKGTEVLLAAMDAMIGAQAPSTIRTIRISKAFRTGRSADQTETVGLMTLGSEDALETLTIKTSYPSCELVICQESGDEVTRLGGFVARKPQPYAGATYDLTVGYSAAEGKLYVQFTDAHGLDGHVLGGMVFDLADVAGAR